MENEIAARYDTVYMGANCKNMTQLVAFKPKENRINDPFVMRFEILKCCTYIGKKGVGIKVGTH